MHSVPEGVQYQTTGQLGPRSKDIMTQCLCYDIPCMRGSRKFCQRGSNFDMLFFVGGGGQLVRGGSKYQNGLTLNAALVALWSFSFAKKAYILWFFRRGPDPPPPPLWIRACGGRLWVYHDVPLETITVLNVASSSCRETLWSSLEPLVAAF